MTNACATDYLLFIKISSGSPSVTLDEVEIGERKVDKKNPVQHRP